MEHCIRDGCQPGGVRAALLGQLQQHSTDIDSAGCLSILERSLHANKLCQQRCLQGQ